jgi:mannose/cellobiose epimerase-like protein (N-acyl-D-glucosamine 2-epimerase family)
MMLEVNIGEHITVRFDDEMTESRPTPELIEDILTRMARTAERLWDGRADETADALIEPVTDEQP